VWQIIIDLAIVAKCFGVATSYLIVIGELMPSVFEYFAWHGPHDILLDRRTWITLTAVFPIVQLAFLPVRVSLSLSYIRVTYGDYYSYRHHSMMEIYSLLPYLYSQCVMDG